MMSPLPRLRLTLLLAAWVFAGCGRPFAIQTPPGLVELPGQTDFAYRAMTPDGVVLGVRVVDAGNADVAFWTEAVWLHMKDLTGYALLTSADVSSADGTRGKELRFSHVDHGRDFEYTVRVFVQGHHLFVVEAGGTKEDMSRYRAALDGAMASLRFN